MTISTTESNRDPAMLMIFHRLYGVKVRVLIRKGTDQAIRRVFANVAKVNKDSFALSIREFGIVKFEGNNDTASIVNPVNEEETITFYVSGAGLERIVDLMRVRGYEQDY